MKKLLKGKKKKEKIQRISDKIKKMENVHRSKKIQNVFEPSSWTLRC